MEFIQKKKTADTEVLEIYKEYLDNGYNIDFEKSSPTSMYFTKLIGVDENDLTARFSHIQVVQNTIFTEKNFNEEQKYACKHPITPYLISTAVVTEPLSPENIFNLSKMEIMLIEQFSGAQLSIPGFGKPEFQTTLQDYERGE